MSMGGLSTRGRISSRAAYDVHRRSARFACLLRTPGTSSTRRPTRLSDRLSYMEQPSRSGIHGPPGPVRFRGVSPLPRVAQSQFHPDVALGEPAGKRHRAGVMYGHPTPGSNRARRSGRRKGAVQSHEVRSGVFDRLRTRATRSAGERGLCSVISSRVGARFSIDGYNAHPFKATNNVNGHRVRPQSRREGDSSASPWQMRP